MHPTHHIVKFKGDYVVLNYGLFTAGVKIQGWDTWGKNFLEWFIQKPKYKGYRIVIAQYSEPLSDAGQQSESNKYLLCYEGVAKILKDRDVTFISDYSSDEFREWMKTEFGWKTHTYHFHFDTDITLNDFISQPIRSKSELFERRFMCINGNMVNEHKPKMQKVFTTENIWNDAYWSFGEITNFGMEIYKDKNDLFRIFNNLIPLFDKSFVYLVTETCAEQFITGTNIPIDFLSKAGRALATLNPFIIWGSPYTLKRLRDMGFQTFSRWWDESYDEILDMDERIKAIQNLVNQIKNLTFEELVKMYNEMLPIFLSNRARLIQLTKQEKMNIEKDFEGFFDNTDYNEITEYEVRETEFLQKLPINKNVVCYYKRLDGGGSTFGINALKSPAVEKHIRKGNILEMCSGPAFMGFYLNFNGYADNLYLTDINPDNKVVIAETIGDNGLTNTRFIQSDVFDGMGVGIKFDTIVSNPPHFKTERLGGYRSYEEKIISLDADMRFHKKFFEDVKYFIHKDTAIILVENEDGVTSDDIIELTKNDFRVELIERDKYGWPGKSSFYTIVLYLL